MSENMTAEEALDRLGNRKEFVYERKDGTLTLFEMPAKEIRIAEFETIRTELEALRKDAERYREQLEQAHMAGQSDAGVDPSYSNAQLYVDAALEADNAQHDPD